MTAPHIPQSADGSMAQLLQRARQLLGDNGGGDGGATELARCLRRLYRAQNRLDSVQLQQLGQDVMQALAGDDSETGAQLRAAAALLAGVTQPATSGVAAGMQTDRSSLTPGRVEISGSAGAHEEQPAEPPSPPAAPASASAPSVPLRHSTSSRGLPTLSVVIPAYNAQPYLRATVGSLLADAPDDMELIVVDDGSSDDTLAIAHELASADGRIRVIHQANALTAAARNAGLAAASGDYVGFVDDDDEVEPGWAKKLLRTAAQKHRPAIVKGEARVFQGGRELPPPRTCAVVAQFTPLHWFALMWSAIYRRDFVQGHGLHFAPEFFSDDVDFQVRAVVAMLLDKEKMALCPQAVYRWLRRPDGTESPRLDRRKVACNLYTYRGLHELSLEHYRRLPPTGVGAQYFTWIRNLFDIARRAEHPDDGAAANALAQRLLAECPCPETLEDERLKWQHASLRQIRPPSRP